MQKLGEREENCLKHFLLLKSNLAISFDRKAIHSTFISHLIPGIDEQLAKHIAHFFIRDPISLFSGKIKVDDEKELEHFDVSCLHFIPALMQLSSLTGCMF